MRLSAPKKGTWIIAVAAGLLGIVLHYGVIHIGLLGSYAFLLVAGAFALLAVATLMNQL